jgi:hypothetical protein
LMAIANTRMTKSTQSPHKVARPLTERQRAFVVAWLENGGNGTKAAMLAYGCSTPNAAAVIASRLLRNENIRRAIEAEMAEAGLSVGAIIGRISERINGIPSLNAQLDYIGKLFKLLAVK